MEMHEKFAHPTAALFKNNFTKVEIHKDLSGKERFLEVIY
jgi:hypothetical protein